MNRVLRAAAVAPALLALLVSGCDTPKAAKDSIDERQVEAADLMTKAERPATIRRGGAVSVTDAVWVGGRSVLSVHGSPLPAHVEAPGAIVLNSMGIPLELREIVAEIVAQSGLGVVLDTEAPVGDDSTTSSSPGVDATGTALPPIPLPGGGSRPPAASGSQQRMTLSWNGPLSGLLDAVAAYYEMSWEHRDGSIRFYRYESRTFTLAALPSTSTIRSSVSTSGSSGGGGSGGSGGGGGTTTSGSMLQDTSNETSVTLWEDVLASVKAMLPAGAYATMSPGTGTISVMAPPAAMRRVAAFIEEQNARITRQVTVSVKVLRLDLTDDFNLGLDLGLVFEHLQDQYEVVTGGPVPFPAGDGGSWAIRALRNTVGNQGNWATTEASTRAVVTALQEAGNVSLVTETNVTTLNGQAAPVSVSRQQSYVASTTTSIASGTSATTQTEVTPGTIITGFNMQVLPRILDDGQVLLQYGLSLSDLRELLNFSTGGTTIQLPDVNIRSFLQQAILRNNDVLVLAGYQSVNDSLDERATPGLGYLLGGGSAAQRGKSVLVILLTPRIHDAAGAGAQ